MPGFGSVEAPSALFVLHCRAKGSLHIWHCAVPASWLHLEMQDFGLGVKKSEIIITTKKRPVVWGKGGRRELFCTFRGPCSRERLLSFINGSDSRKPSVRREIKQLGVGSEGSRKAMERGSRARSRRGNAELRSWRGAGGGGRV